MAKIAQNNNGGKEPIARGGEGELEVRDRAGIGVGGG
jgi:hypothetical protein